MVPAIVQEAARPFATVYLCAAADSAKRCPGAVDDSSRCAHGAAMCGRHRLWRAETTGGYPQIIGIFNSGPICERPQCCYRQHKPVPRDPCGVCPSSLLPLPPDTLQRPEAQLYPEPKPIPAHSRFIRREIGLVVPPMVCHNAPAGANSAYVRHHHCGSRLGRLGPGRPADCHHEDAERSVLLLEAGPLMMTTRAATTAFWQLLLADIVP